MELGHKCGISGICMGWRASFSRAWVGTSSTSQILAAGFFALLGVSGRHRSWTGALAHGLALLSFIWVSSSWDLVRTTGLEKQSTRKVFKGSLASEQTISSWPALCWAASRASVVVGLMQLNRPKAYIACKYPTFHLDNSLSQATQPLLLRYHLRT